MTKKELNNLKVGDIVKVVSVDDRFKDQVVFFEQRTGGKVVGTHFKLTNTEIERLKSIVETALGDNTTQINFSWKDLAICETSSSEQMIKRIILKGIKDEIFGKDKAKGKYFLCLESSPFNCFIKGRVYELERNDGDGILTFRIDSKGNARTGWSVEKFRLIEYEEMTEILRDL